ncbi:hypothetical protein MBLNU457_6326t2 [Dothideomycetes sp. NU457]
MQQWDLETYEDWTHTIERENRDPSLPKSGLKIVDSHSFWTTKSTTAPWWTQRLPSYRPLALSSPQVHSANAFASSSNQIAAAGTFKSIAINVPQYLSYLRTIFTTFGGVVIQSTLPITPSLSTSLSHLTPLMAANNLPTPDLIVNATGLMASALAHDDSVYPIRGQTILVRGEALAVRCRMRTDGMDYVIPRPGSGTTILGGTKEENNYSPVPDQKVTEGILEGCKGLAPELVREGAFEVLSVQVGLRPGRRGGARMEREVVGKWRVVHVYGHAGAGYQNSVGVARRVVGMVREVLGEEKARL